jgi:uroporphyrinogen III methyltransferase/synthase
MVTFTSSSTVRNLMALLDNDPHALSKTIVACIGPVTAAEARALGLKVAIVAREYSVLGLVRAMEENSSGRRAQDR